MSHFHFFPVFSVSFIQKYCPPGQKIKILHHDVRETIRNNSRIINPCLPRKLFRIHVIYRLGTIIKIQQQKMKTRGNIQEKNNNNHTWKITICGLYFIFLLRGLAFHSCDLREAENMIDTVKNI